MSVLALDQQTQVPLVERLTLFDQLMREFPADLMQRYLGRQTERQARAALTMEMTRPLSELPTDALLLSASSPTQEVLPVPSEPVTLQKGYFSGHPEEFRLDDDEPPSHTERHSHRRPRRLSWWARRQARKAAK